jgi:peptidyl-prolyl cis-trans isomerase D
MITWMQRHRKYLNITLWISVGAFIAAGPMFAIGSGSFSGRGADTIAKVGNVEVSMHQMNSAYRQLFSRYNQMFQGKFDESQAKAFGLEQQALKQLIDESLLLNLAQSFNLVVLDKELSDNISKTDAFFKDAKFDKETYIKVLKQAQLSLSDYEDDVRRSLLIQKLMGMLSVQSLPLEEDAVSTALYINDKINYKILDKSMITVDTKEEALKAYWESNKMSYMSEPSFELEVITQDIIAGTYSDEELKAAYDTNKHDFTTATGEIKSFEEAKEAVVATLDKDASNKEALRTYIDYKKERLDPAHSKQSFVVQASNNPFSAEVYEKISKLSLEKPYLKPQYVDGKFLIIKLLSSKGSEPKTYEQAKSEVKTDYLTQETNKQFFELAKNSVETFKGKTSKFLTRESISGLAPLKEVEAAEFLEALFLQDSKRGFIPLKGDKIVLYNILEQKLLKKENNTQENNVLRIKTSLLTEGLLKKLEAHYPVTSYLEGK